jgi:hypothetical protein
MLARDAGCAWHTNQKGETMTKRIQQLFVSVAALSALALGGSAIASAQTGANHATPASQAANVTGTSTGMSGNQSAPDAQGSTETAGESASAEQPGTAEQPGSESAANSDGPGGHADEPGNATADHQFQGQE